jgi:hypothetical protein
MSTRPRSAQRNRLLVDGVGDVRAPPANRLIGTASGVALLAGPMKSRACLYRVVLTNAYGVNPTLWPQRKYYNRRESTTKSVLINSEGRNVKKATLYLTLLLAANSMIAMIAGTADAREARFSGEAICRHVSGLT